LIIDLFSKRFFKNIVESLKYFSNKTFKWTQKVLKPCEIPIISSKTKAKKFPKNLIKSWDVTDYHP
jgi:hypothetical protein